MPSELDPNHDHNIEEVQGLCALRFDGYAFEARRGGDGRLAFWARRIVATVEPLRSELENFAAFFALQRFLGKWGRIARPELARAPGESAAIPSAPRPTRPGGVPALGVL